MKFRLITLILTLALSLVGWSQDTPAAPNSTPIPQAACCHHNMADVKDDKGCCHRAAADVKDTASCCSKDKCEMKDGKPCCDGKDMKAAMKECKKNGCCAGKSCSNSKGDKTAMNCCSSKCERHPQPPSAS
ncbi:MAG: hypothetical protein WAK62_14240 [Terriglobales bacterium]